MATFKLKNGQTDSGTVPGIGNYVNGVLKNAPEDFENPNFERVEEQTKPTTQTPVPTAPAAPAASPAPTVPQIDAEMQSLEEERNKIEKTEGVK